MTVEQSVHEKRGDDFDEEECVQFWYIVQLPAPKQTAKATRSTCSPSLWRATGMSKILVRTSLFLGHNLPPLIEEFPNRVK
jgi:hypothetical protein